MQVRGTFPELNAGMKKRSRKSPKPAPGRVNKVQKAMHEFKAGALKSGGSGKTVTSRKQAVAIGLSEQRKENAGGYDTGGSMFGAKRAPRRINAPKTLGGRRNASHDKAYPV